MEGISEVLKKQQFNLDFSSLRCLVIGGNGYFGYKLVEALVGKGVPQVRVFDRIQTRFQGCPEVEFYVGDICDPVSVATAVRDMHVVFHTASCFGNPPFGSFGEGKLEWQVNVEGTRNVIKSAREEAARQRRPVKLIYIGSSSAAFNGEREFFNEPEETPYPSYHVDHYGRCKAIAEQEVCSASSDESGLLTCVLRPNGIYGENEMIHIPRVRRLCGYFFGVMPVIFPSRSDWTFVDNLSFACLLAAERLALNSQTTGQLYNITDGEPATIDQIFGPAIEATGGKFVPIIPLPVFLFYIFSFICELFCFLTSPVLNLHSPFTRIEAIKIAKSHSFSIKKAKERLGYVPIVSFNEGIHRAAEDFKKRYSANLEQKKSS